MEVIIINRRIIRAFLAAEVMLYVCFMLLDILSVVGEHSHNAKLEALYPISLVIKYISVLLCMLLAVTRAVYALRRKKAAWVDRNRVKIPVDDSRDCALTAMDENINCVMIAVALIFTVTADWFIVFGNDNLAGIFCFCAVQTIYIFVIEDKKALYSIIARIVLSAAVFLALQAYFPDDGLLIAVALFYGISFVGNIIHQSVKTSRLGKTLKDSGDAADLQSESLHSNRLFLIGLILFILCDINVLFYNIGGFIDIGLSGYDMLQSISLVLMWAFYLPSQVLIVLSSRISADYQK